MPATPLINGINYSWANIRVILFGVPVVGILKIDYKRKQKKENNYGFGSEPVSRGYGNKEYDGSIELYTDEWQRIVNASPNHDPMAIAPFDIQVSFSGSGVATTSHTLKSCEFTEDPFEAKQGDTKLTVNIPLIIAAIQK
jgi:hypothetical protein